MQQKEKTMNVELNDLDRALALARRMVEDHDCRCVTCDGRFEVTSEVVMLSGAGPLFQRKLAKLRFECTACNTRTPLPWGFEEELSGRLDAGEAQGGRKPPDVCPECGSRMEPNGRCFVCRGCGHSTCG
jgi:hypothetical protein